MARRRRRLLVLLAATIGAAGVLVGAADPVGASTPTTTDPSAWWAFEDGSGTTAVDIAGNHNATLHSPASFATGGPSLEGANSGVLAFNGAGYATASATGLENLQQFTVATWVQVTTPPSSEANLVGIDGKASLALGSGVIPAITFTVFTGSGYRRINDFPDLGGAWHLFVGTYDGSTTRLYEDGSPAGSLASSVVVNAGTGITLGDSSWPQTVSIDETRIYSRALSPTEVRRLAFNCNTVTEIPLSECQALEDLYLATNGASWSGTADWLTSSTPCSWSGLLCVNGHVAFMTLSSRGLSGTLPLSISNLPDLIVLDLSSNRLVGALPATLGNLLQLQTLNVRDNGLSGSLPANIGRLTGLHALNLANNQLTGDVPTGVTSLTGLTGLDITNNGLDPSSSAVRDFFTTNQPTWLASQTIAPTGITVSRPTGTTATFTWTPIAYTGDGGYYEVLSVDPTSGATTSMGQTANKTATGLTLTGLTADVQYSFVVRTVTPPHGTEQLNTVTSEPRAAVPVTTVTTTEDTAPSITWDSWMSVTDPAARGGTYRMTATAGATSAFPFSGRSVTWLARRGPDRGLAAVTVDGVSKGTVDLYGAAPANANLVFGGLTPAKHVLTVRVLGTKRAAATGANVTVDGFLVGTSTTPVQETATPVRFDSWTGVSSTHASGRSYRGTATAGATATFAFTGTAVDWITAYGPSLGRAAVSVDGGSSTTVDLYRATASWGVVGRSFSGLASGSHTISVRVLGTRNALSTGKTAVVDAFRVSG